MNSDTPLLSAPLRNVFSPQRKRLDIFVGFELCFRHMDGAVRLDCWFTFSLQGLCFRPASRGQVQDIGGSRTSVPNALGEQLARSICRESSCGRTTCRAMYKHSSNSGACAVWHLFFNGMHPQVKRGHTYETRANFEWSSLLEERVYSNRSLPDPQQYSMLARHCAPLKPLRM